MSDAIITVENVGKRYSLHHETSASQTDSIDVWKSPNFRSIWKNHRI